MKRNMKILSVLALVCAFSVVGGISAIESKAQVQVNTLDGLSAVGGSIRLDGNPQMRFEFTLSGDAQTAYAEKIANGEVTTGIVYMPYDLYSGDLSDFTLDTENRAYSETTSDWNVKEDETHLTSYGYVLASDIIGYNRILIARAYLTDGETTYYSTETAKASMAWLAWQNYDAYKADYATQLDEYRGTHTLTYNETTCFTGAYGETIALEDANVDGYTFGGWYWDEDLTTEIGESDYITASDAIYPKLTGSTISVSGLSLVNANITLTNSDGTKETKTGVSGSEFAFENIKNGTYTALEIEDGTNEHCFYATAIEVQDETLTLSADDFVKDPVNTTLTTGVWKRQDFVRNYNETDGVYYTLNNPANGTGAAAMMYTHAPLTLEASNKVTVSYDVTVEQGGPLCFGISLGANRSALSDGTNTTTPKYNLWVRLDANTGAFAWSNAYDYNGEVAGDGNITNMFWSQALPSITGFGTSFNVKIVRDNGIVAFFIDDNLAFYLNEDVKPIVSGYKLGDTPLYYAISVRSNNANGTGSATFKNITATNTADLSAYFTTVTGKNSLLNADTSVTVSGIDTISGRSITINQTMANVVDANGNFSFVVPYGNYDVTATAEAGSLAGTLTANSAAVTLTLSENYLATIGAVSLSGAQRATAIPTDYSYSADGTQITFAGVSTGDQQTYTLKNTVGKTFTFETTITGDASQMVGAGVTCGAEQITMMFASWEPGNVVIQATGHASSGSDFVVTGVDDVIDDNNQINATLKFVQNGTTSLAMYVNDKLVCTITSAGFTLGDGIAYKTTTDQTNAETTSGWWSRGTVAIRYLTRGEFACALTGYMTSEQTVSYTVSFKENA